MAQHRPPKPLRLFIAATPSEEWRGRALAMLDSMQLPEHKATGIEQLHLTVLFLGERRPGLMPDILESVTAAARSVPAFSLEPVRLIALPEEGMARLVAVEMSAPTALLELQKRLASRLVKEEKRSGKFVPHLTLCRFGGMGVERSLLPKRDEANEAAMLKQLGAFQVREISLVSSVLHPKGARHTVEHVAKVGA
ncbi:MAG: RNA 2',3'-cyclic phosphodiesterase [Phycisphaerales bacterium]